jgi:hypothetical protein
MAHGVWYPAAWCRKAGAAFLKVRTLGAHAPVVALVISVGQAVGQRFGRWLCHVAAHEQANAELHAQNLLVAEGWPTHASTPSFKVLALQSPPQGLGYAHAKK